MNCKALEKPEQSKSKTYTRKEMIMIRTEINEIKTKKPHK